MAPKKKPSSDTAETDMLGASVRMTIAQRAWANERAKTLGGFNTVMRQLVDDARSLYGLPDVLREQLDTEAAALGKERREYIIHILTLHAVELLNRRTGEHE